MTDAAPRRLGVQERGLFVLLTLLVWVAHWNSPEDVATTALDPSWHQALGYALLHGLRFGHDVVFTYGPLGWFFGSAWQPELFFAKVVLFEGVFKLVLSAFFVRALVRIPGAVEKLLFALVIAVANFGLDAYFMTCVVLVGSWILEHAHEPARRSAPAWLLLAILGLVKFTFLFLVGVVFAAVVFAAWRAGGRRRAWHQAALGAALVFATWLACLQNPLDLPLYVARSLEVATGYSEAMSNPVPELDYVLAAAAGALLLLALVFARASASVVFTFLAGAFLAFKGGFVASGSTKMTCFGFLAVAPFLTLPHVAESARASLARLRLASAARIACVALAAWGYFRSMPLPEDGVPRTASQWNETVAANWSDIVAPGELRRRREETARATRAANELPRVRAAVGERTIDVFSSEQGIVFLNDLTWRPRPVFQSYAVYTPGLAEINAEHFRGPRAPDFVLMRPTVIDTRLPGMDDSPALIEVMSRYHAIISEGGFVLYERDATPRKVEGTRRVVYEKTLPLFDELVLDAETKLGSVLYLDVQPTLAGRLRRAVAGAPRIDVDVMLASGSGPHRCRLIPGSARAGIVVFPLVDGLGRLESLSCGLPQERIASLTIVETDEVRACYQSEMRVRLEELPAMLPTVTPESTRRLEYSMFDRVPDEVVTAEGAYSGTLAGRSVRVVNVNAELRFELPPGKYRWTAKYGVMDEAWNTGCTDGAGFLLVVRHANGQRQPMWRKLIDPTRNADERGLLDVAIDFELAPGDSVAMRTGPGPKNDGSCDWCCWSDVRFDPLPPN